MGKRKYKTEKERRAAKRESRRLSAERAKDRRAVAQAAAAVFYSKHPHLLETDHPEAEDVRTGNGALKGCSLGLPFPTALAIGFQMLDNDDPGGLELALSAEAQGQQAEHFVNLVACLDGRPATDFMAAGDFTIIGPPWREVNEPDDVVSFMAGKIRHSSYAAF